MLEKIKKINIKDIYDILKIILAFIPGMIVKLCNEKIWIIAEKENNARDNGVQFFKYLMKHGRENVYYAINYKSNDFNEVSIYKKNLIKFGSFKHHIYTWAASSYISSEIDAGFPSPRVCSILVRKKVYRFNNIFLEHGITQNSPECLYKKNSGVNFVTTAAIKETDFFINQLGYQQDEVKCTGFARYDYLNYEKNTKTILFMPTWRSTFDTDKQDYEQNRKKFITSSYYKQIQSYINNPKLLDFLEKNNLQFILYLHDKIQPYRKEFKSKSKNILIPSNQDIDFHDMLIKTDYFITDYSSVAFDIAYMNKPLQYFQYDIQEFRDHLKEGYFSYQNDGFGPVTKTITSSINQLIASYQKQFQVESRYQERRDNFFKYNDQNNCLRIEKEITNYEDKNKARYEKKRQKIQTICNYLMLFLIFLYPIFYCYNFMKLMAIINLIFWIFLVLMVIDNPKKNIYLILFLVAMFTFLLGKPLISLNGYDEWWYRYGEYNTRFAELLIAISEVTIFYSLKLVRFIKTKKSITIEKKFVFNYDFLQKISFLLFIISFIFTMIVETDKLIFMQGKSYAEFYTSYTNNFNFLINFIAGIMPTALCIFLITFPKKKISLIVLMLYALTCVPSFMIGIRNPLVLCGLFSISYVVIRDIKEKWIGKKEKIAFIIMIPIGILTLSIFNYIRDNENISNKNLFKDFFYMQGVTFDTLRISYNNIATIRSYKNKNYTFGPFIDYAKYSTLSQIIFKTKPLDSGNSVDKALNSNSFAHINSYLSRTDYLEGHGYGSSYIIETYVDYSYFGVILFNVFITFILSYGYEIIKKKDLLSIIFLEISTTIFLIPRAEATQFLLFLITPHFLITILTVYILSYLYDRMVIKHAHAKIN